MSIEQTTTFFEEIVVQSLIEIRIFGRDSGPTAAPLGREWFNTPTEAAAFALDPKWSDAHVYFGATPRKDRRGTKDAVRGAWSIWADVDGDLPPRAMALPPSYVVRSGHGYHIYWRLKTLAVCAEDLTEALQAAQAVTQGDKVSDPNRLLRVPGTWNVKGEPPLPCEIVSRTDVRYELADLIAIQRVPPVVLDLILTGDSSKYPSRSERDWYLITSLVTAGLSDLAIQSIFAHHPCGDKADDDGGHNLDFTLAKARKEIGGVNVKRASLGLYERRGDGYFKGSANGETRLSTFTIHPVALLADDGQEYLKADVTQDHQVTRGRVFPKSCFLNVASLSKQLGQLGWQWLGSDRDVRYLGAYLAEFCRDKSIPKQAFVETLGRHGQYWVGSDCVFTSTEDWEAAGPEAPLTCIPKTSEYTSTCYTFEDPANQIRELLPLLTQLNQPQVVYPILGWYLATPFKPALAELGVRFPILNIFGSRGAGKTTIVQQVMLPLLGIRKPIMHDCNTTRFVMLSLLGSSNAIPVALAEFRQSSLSAAQYSMILRTVLLGYDSGRDSRGRADQTVVEYPLSAPFSIDGEDQLPDQAAKERVIAVPMSPNDVAPNSVASTALDQVRAMDLTFFAGPYIRWTLDQDVPSLWDQAEIAVALAFPGHLPHRVRRNIITAYMGLVALKEYCDTVGVAFDLPDAGILQCTATSVVSAAGVSQVMADEFVEDVLNHFSIHGGIDFACYLDTKRQQFWFNVKSAYGWWVAYRRRLNQGALEHRSILHQLRERAQGDGHYVLDSGEISFKRFNAVMWRMLGIDLFAAFQAGLEIPQDIRLESEAQ